jgi:CheY-like chemotaxis protein
LPLAVVGPFVRNESDYDWAPTGLRILIVEDDDEIADTLSEILRSNGHHIDIAADGQEGLKRALSVSYDLILSDMRMPILDGPGLYQALQRDRPDLLNRIAFVTGDTLSAEIRSFLDQTSALCLEKPFLPEDVLNLLTQVTRRGTAAAAD